MQTQSHTTSVAKAITWRGLAGVDTVILSFVLTGSVGTAFGIAGFEVLTKSVIYYCHERAWLWFARKPRPSNNGAVN